MILARIMGAMFARMDSCPASQPARSQLVLTPCQCFCVGTGPGCKAKEKGTRQEHFGRDDVCNG